MDFASGKSGDGGGGVKEVTKTEHSVGGDDDGRHNQETVVEEAGPTTSAKKEEVDDHLIENAKAEMKEVIEENKRLKTCLNKILNEYRALEIQFQDIVKKETKKEEADDKGNNEKQQEITTEESDLVSLSLGRVPRNNNDEKVKVSKPLKDDEGLTLGLECKFETSKSGSTSKEKEAVANASEANSFEVPREEETGENSKRIRDAEDEVAQQNPAKKARVCVRARCDTLTLNDGCQWRKYGQKIAKGNPCPRAYYRCTIAPTCPVRKQVQRCAEDTSILITTYEGIHNHSLPLSATAMASTTSAAASMLLSGSSTSHSAASFSSTTVPNTLPHGLNFDLSEYGSNNQSNKIYITNPSLSSSPSHPTITLDLTSSHPSHSSSSSSPFFRLANNQPIRFPSSTSLSFGNSTSSSEPNNSIMPNWSSNGVFLNNHHNRNYVNLLNSVSFGGNRQPVMTGNNNNNHIYQYSNGIIQKNNNSVNPDTISAITADPKFQSALAAALTTFIGGGGSSQGTGENLMMSQKMKWGEMFPSTTSKVNACATSFFNKTTTQTPSSLTFLPPSSTSKSASASPAQDNNNNNSDSTK